MAQDGKIYPAVYIRPNLSFTDFEQKYLIANTDRYFSIVHLERTPAHTTIFKFEVDLSIPDAVVMGCLPTAKLVVSCEFSNDFTRLDRGTSTDNEIIVNIPPRDFYFTDNSHDARLGFFCKRDGTMIANNKLCNRIWYCTFIGCVRYLSGIGGYNKEIEHSPQQKERPQYGRVLSIATVVVQIVMDRYFTRSVICRT